MDIRYDQYSGENCFAKRFSFQRLPGKKRRPGLMELEAKIPAAKTEDVSLPMIDNDLIPEAKNDLIPETMPDSTPEANLNAFGRHYKKPKRDRSAPLTTSMSEIFKKLDKSSLRF